MPIETGEKTRAIEADSRFNEKQESEFAETLVGMKVTAAAFSLQDGYMIEFDDRIRFRTCCAHGRFLRRVIQ